MEEEVKIMNKKGQAAMEFLMTYGWAILVVIAAIAVLAASGLLDLSRYMPERCDFPIDMPCEGKASVSSREVRLAVRNSLDTAITINGVGVSGTVCPGLPLVAEGVSGDLQNSSWGNLSVAKQEIFRIQVNCSLTTGDTFDQTVFINYTRADNGIIYPLAGDIKTKVN
jgi:hypothetical protein